MPWKETLLMLLLYMYFPPLNMNQQTLSLFLSVGSYCVYCLVTGFLDLMMYEKHLSMSISIDLHNHFKKLPSVLLY